MLPKGKEIAASASCSNSAAARRNFPPEVISGILLRLPMKPLLRFKCVSTQWRTLVSHPEFISAHLTRSPASLLIHAFKSPNPTPEHEPSFYVVLEAEKKAAEEKKARLKSGKEPQPQPEEEETQLQPDGHAIYTYQLLNPHFKIHRILDFPGSEEAGFKNLEVVGVQNGVVCIALEPFLKKFILWNPATRLKRYLPGPSIRLSKKFYSASSAGFGYDPAKNEYKVIRIMRHSNILAPDVAEFFDTRVWEWKRVGQRHGQHTRFWVKRQSCDAVVKGVPYWRAKAAFDIRNHRRGELDTEVLGTLLWFDVTDDVFDLEQCTWVEESREMCFGEIKDCLGVALWEVGSADHGRIEVRVKEGRNNWSLKYRVGPLPWVGPSDLKGLPESVNVVGFYGDRGIVQEVGRQGNLIMFDLEKMAEKEDSVNGQDSSKKENDDSFNGQDSSKKEKDDSVNGQDPSREENDDSVNGQDLSRKEIEELVKEKNKDLVSKIDDVINVKDSLPFTLKTMIYRETMAEVKKRAKDKE